MVLEDHGESKIEVIKALRTLRHDLSLSDAKELVEAVPTEVVSDVPEDEAKEVLRALREAGATGVRIERSE